jgi:hypothetical protein
MLVVLLCACVAVVSLILYTGASSKSPASAPPTAQGERLTPHPVVKPVADRAAAPPTVAEIRAVVKRIYQEAATVDESRARAFAVGDFNGDQSQDIAILTRPVKGKLSQLNDEYANWIIEDPLANSQSEPAQNTQTKKPAPVRVEPNDLFLTIVHGYEQEGWRHRMATQTYLLRNAGGSDLERLSAREVLNQNGERLAGLRGDVLRETVAGESGFIYWTGSKYTWQKTQ